MRSVWNDWRNPNSWIALAVASLGGVVLLGWALDVPGLRSFLPGAVQMKANTALALILSAVALRAGSSGSVRAAGMRVACASLVLAIGSLTLAEYAFGLKVGIDELLFLDKARAFNVIPGRMSPYTAAAFAAIGFSFALEPAGLRRTAAFLGGLVCGLIGLGSLLGYVWSAREVTTDQWIPPVALNTAGALFLLGISAGWRAYGKSSIFGPASGQRGTPQLLETKVLIGFLLALLLLVFGGGITYRMQLSFARSADLISATDHARRALNEVYATVAAAESAQRHYLLLPDLTDRLEFASADEAARTALHRLELAVLALPTERDSAAHLTALVLHRLDVLRQHLRLFDQEGPEAVRRAISNDDGLQTMRQIQSEISKADGEASRDAARWGQELARARSRTIIALLGTMLIAATTLLILFMSIVHDVRERARIVAALEQARREAQEATQAKSRFLASMSHEIRTPMNGVLGLLELLQQSSLLPHQQEMVTLTRESAVALLAIIDDILDFSKIEAGRLEIESAPLRLSQAVEKVCALLNRLAERRGTSLLVFCDPRIPDEVLGDATRVRQVLLNLTNNAIKFCSGLERPGRVSVRAELVRAEATQCWVQFTVSDNGIGMSEETRSRLFGSFMQADHSTTRRYGGTGLGLAISQQLVSLMGGEIQVETEPERGSTFRVLLPFTSSAGTEETQRGAPPQVHPEIRGLPCLVIGGDQGLANDLATYLAHAGASVERVEGIEAAQSLSAPADRELTVWVIESESDLPGVPELIKRLRQASDSAIRIVLVVLSRGPRVPIAEVEGAVVVDGNALHRDSLVQAVATAAGRSGTGTVIASSQPERSAVISETREEALRSGRLILVAEDNELNQRVIREQLRVLGYAADIASDGKRALEQWRKEQYGLILADLHMPEMDGYDLALAIRVEEQGASRVPIIALTANALAGEAKRCRAVGMDGYLTKPAPLEVLARELERWLPPRAVPQSMPGEVPVRGIPQTAVDIEVLKDLIGGDSELIGELVAEFRSSAARLRQELLTSAKDSHPTGVASAAHRLKSSARSLGASRLGEICAALETSGTQDDLSAITRGLVDLETELATVLSELELSVEQSTKARRTA